MLNLVTLVTGNGRAGRFEFRGDEIEPRLRDKEIELHEVVDMASVLVTAAGGRLFLAQVLELLLMSPLLVPRS